MKDLNKGNIRGVITTVIVALATVWFAQTASASGTLAASARMDDLDEARLFIAAGADLNLPEPEPPAPPPFTEPPASPNESSATATVGWVSLATGVALSGTAIFLGTRFLAAKSDYEDREPSSRSARERAATLRTWTNVAWGGAALTGGVGLALLLASPTIEF